MANFIFFSSKAPPIKGSDWAINVNKAIFCRMRHLLSNLCIKLIFISSLYSNTQSISETALKDVLQQVALPVTNEIRGCKSGLSGTPQICIGGIPGPKNSKYIGKEIYWTVDC